MADGNYKVVKEEVLFDEEVVSDKSPFGWKQNPTGGPFFICISKGTPNDVKGIKVPWGRFVFQDYDPVTLPEFDGVVLETMRRIPYVHVIASGLPKMSVEKQREIWAPVLEILRDKNVTIENGVIMKGGKLYEVDIPALRPVVTIECPVCGTHHTTRFCGECGEQLVKEKASPIKKEKLETKKEDPMENSKGKPKKGKSKGASKGAAS